MPTRYDSLSPKNKFTFTCPVFNAKTTMGACTTLREGFAVAKKLEVRRGCQAAMACGMCPANAMISLYSYDRSWTNDHHGSLEPKEGRLHARVLGKIANVVPQPRVLDKFLVSDAERQLLLSAGERIEAQLRTAPGENIEKPVIQPVRRKREATAPTPAPKPEITPTINQAAKTGDLAAAVNA